MRNPRRFGQEIPAFYGVTWNQPGFPPCFIEVPFKICRDFWRQSAWIAHHVFAALEIDTLYRMKSICSLWKVFKGWTVYNNNTRQQLLYRVYSTKKMRVFPFIYYVAILPCAKVSLFKGHRAVRTKDIHEAIYKLHCQEKGHSICSSNIVAS